MVWRSRLAAALKREAARRPRGVAVPHPLTAGLDLSAADLVVPSLSDYPLPTPLARLDGEG